MEKEVLNQETKEIEKVEGNQTEETKKVLPDAILMKRKREIKLLEKQKEDLINGPTPLERNGRILNQIQIDNWNKMTEEEKLSKQKKIDEQIEELRKEEKPSLEEKIELQELEVEESAHEKMAKRLEDSIKIWKDLEQEIAKLENTQEK